MGGTTQLQLVFLLTAFLLLVLTTAAGGAVLPDAAGVSVVPAEAHDARDASNDEWAQYLEIEPDLANRVTNTRGGRGHTDHYQAWDGRSTPGEFDLFGGTIADESRQGDRQRLLPYLPGCELDPLCLIGAAQSSTGGTPTSAIAAEKNQLADVTAHAFAVGGRLAGSAAMTPSRGAFSLALYCCLIGGFTLLAVIVRRVDRHLRRRRYLAWKEPKYPIVIADRRVRLRTHHKSSRKGRPHLDLLKIHHTSRVTREGRKKVKSPAAGYVICQKPLHSKKFLRPRRPKNFALNTLLPKVNIAPNRMSNDT